MARALGVSEFKINHRMKFRSLIRGHHVYKNIWGPCKGEKLAAHLDDREEALEYDKYAIGIYKEKSNDWEDLVGHVPVEISSLLYHFLRASDGNYVVVEILGKRKCEVGLVVTAKYNAFTTNRRDAKILDAELSKRRTLFVSLELIHKEKKTYRMFPVYK